MSGSIPSWARVGEKVVCITHELTDGATYWAAPPPPLNMPVVVSRVRYPDDCSDGKVRLIIEGYPNPFEFSRNDAGWLLRRFRPLITRTAEQDVGLFVHHLNDVRVTERA